jgi:hypothetical protein
VALTVVLALVAVAVGAVIQGSIGFGYAFVAVPAMALLYTEAVPVTPLLLALPMTVLLGAREWTPIGVCGFFLIRECRGRGQQTPSTYWGGRRGGLETHPSITRNITQISTRCCGTKSSLGAAYLYSPSCRVRVLKLIQRVAEESSSRRLPRTLVSGNPDP